MEERTSTVFGLDVAHPARVTFLDGAGAPATGRSVSLSVIDGDPARDRRPAGAALVCDEQLPDGSVNFRIEADPAAGYLLWGPGWGAHVVSGDGREVSCHPEGLADGAWQRFLVAQVLPFAAVLQGLEVLHASAVRIDGEAIALLGASGSGKTSLALALCERGGEFMCDDVLAVEQRGDALIAHPGPAVASLHPDGHQLPHAPLLAVNERERIVRVEVCEHAAPLAGLFLLTRSAAAPPAPTFAAGADALTLLASTFNFVLDDPARLTRLLDVCAAAASIGVEIVTYGPGTNAPELADAVRERLGER